MGEYGYAYRSISTYTSSTMKNGTRESATIKPFAPFVPKSNNGSNYSEGAVTRKKIVPVTSRPYDEHDESDDEYLHRQTSPVRSSPRKVDDKFPIKVGNHDGSRNPQRFSPVDDRGHHTPQSTGERKPVGGGGTINHDGTYNGTNYAGNKDGRKPIGISPIHGTNNAYGGDQHTTVVGDPNSFKDGRKPIGGGNIRSTHDGYNNGYGSDKEGRKPIGISQVGNDNYHGTNHYGGDHHATAVGDSNPYKEGRKPIGISPTWNGNYDGTNGYGGNHRATAVRDPNSYKEGHKPIGGGSIGSNHDGYNNGYGGDKEGLKPISSKIKDNYDGPNRYGGDHRATVAVEDPNPYREGHKPIAGGSIRSPHDGYNNGYGGGDQEGRKPIGSNFKKGNYDSPNEYGGDYNKKEGYKPIGNYNNNYGIDNRNDKEPRKPFGSSNNPKYDDGVYYNNRSNGPKISSDWITAPRKGTQLSEPIHDIDKALELLKMEAAKRDQYHSNNDHYYDAPTQTPLDNWAAAPGNGSGARATMRPYGNFNQLQSRPRVSPTCVTFVDDGRDHDDDDYYYDRRDDTGHYGYHVPVIDSREAEKKFKGTRV